MKIKRILFICIGLILASTVIVHGQQTSDADSTVVVCHDGQTYFIAESDLQDHLEHGDTQGACPPVSETSGDSEDHSEEDGEKQEKVTICHKGKHTITIAKAAVLVHLDHGDTEGACTDSPENTVGQDNSQWQHQQNGGGQSQGEQDKPEQGNQGKENSNKGDSDNGNKGNSDNGNSGGKDQGGGNSGKGNGKS